ncbi:hypothetical protein H6CHR_05235 [Variovorax sp. PBL-H6]|uniref:DUF3618 domain-containing protein n=1 Tax=Variovorax sp. PBL-H6 TaxID=434009 RepID=UPI00131843F2|nr:DUF3618 domain-containing protein [Variovorax sp. PBL-H6]VTU38499.1 hypothetical protein H6CHR_05235 [Variovorax sp. PBL-H6]
MNHTDRSAEQIQADIQRTRADLDRTLTLLEHRLEPRRLMDQGVDYLRDNGAREYLSNLGRAAKEQPLPLALVGVGLAWMMMTNGRSSSSVADGRAFGDAVGSTAADARSRAAEGMEGLRSRAGEMSGKVSDAASQLASQTRDAAQRTSQGLSEAADAARARAAQVSEATRQGARKVRSGYDHLVNEQPLALGAIGLALGAVLAAAAPRTRQEDEWIGGTSDQLAEDAKRAGKEKLGEMQSAVSEAAAGSKEPVRASDSGEWDAEADRWAQDRDTQQRNDWIKPQEQASASSYGADPTATTPSPATSGTMGNQPL